MNRHPSAIYHEVQLVRQAKFGLVLLVVAIFVIALMSWIMYQQFVLGQPFGDNPMSDSMLTWFGPLYILLGLGMLYLFFAGRMITEVRPDGVYVRWAPFHRDFKKMMFADIAEVEARQYSPIREYGGWGLRFGPKGGAYNMYGNRGVQLVFKNERRLLIGSQRADTMADAIRSVR